MQDQIAEEEDALLAEQAVENNQDDEEGTQIKSVPRVPVQGQNDNETDGHGMQRILTKNALPLAKFFERDDGNS